MEDLVNIYVFTPAPTLFEQDQLVCQAGAFRRLGASRKQHVQRGFLELVEAQNL